VAKPLIRVKLSATFGKISFEFVSAHAALALATVNQRIVKSRFVSRVFPDKPVENDRRINTLDVVAFIDEPTPPRLFDVVSELDTEWSIVPGTAQAAIDFGRGENEAASLRERYDGVDIGCSHEYRINRIPLISKILLILSNFELLAWCLNVDVDVLSSSTSEYSVSKHEESHEYYQHKNHDYSNDAYTAAASAFFGHKVPPIVGWE